MAVSANVYSRVVLSYARALFEAALESGGIDSVGADIKKAAELLGGRDSDVFRDLVSPLVPDAEKASVLEECFKDRAGEQVRNFIRILAEGQRLRYFFDIAEAYFILLDRHNNVLRGNIEVARVPDDNGKKIIMDSLGSVTGKNIQADFVESPELMAGFRTFLGSYYIDYSLSTHLEQLENELKRSS